MKKTKRAAQLTRLDWAYLATAAIELFVARVRLAARPADELLREIQTPLSPSRRPRVPPHEIDVKRLAWAIAALAPNVPWRSDCLIRAVAADRWLRRLNLQPNFYLGVAKDQQGNLVAHAWLRYGDMAVTGGRSDEFSTLLEPSPN